MRLIVAAVIAIIITKIIYNFVSQAEEKRINENLILV
jgi:hypothetical protein